MRERCKRTRYAKSCLGDHLESWMKEAAKLNQRKKVKDLTQGSDSRNEDRQRRKHRPREE